MEINMLLYNITDYFIMYDECGNILDDCKIYMDTFLNVYILGEVGIAVRFPEDCYYLKKIKKIDSQLLEFESVLVYM